MKETIQLVLVVGVIATGIYSLIIGITRSERIECFRWQREAKEYPGYYITAWQKGQCDTHNISIEAPVAENI